MDSQNVLRPSLVVRTLSGAVGSENFSLLAFTHFSLSYYNQPYDSQPCFSSTNPIFFQAISSIPGHVSFLSIISFLMLFWCFSVLNRLCCCYFLLLFLYMPSDGMIQEYESMTVWEHESMSGKHQDAPREAESRSRQWHRQGRKLKQTSALKIAQVSSSSLCHTGIAATILPNCMLNQCRSNELCLCSLLRSPCNKILHASPWSSFQDYPWLEEKGISTKAFLIIFASQI